MKKIAFTIAAILAISMLFAGCVSKERNEENTNNSSTTVKQVSVKTDEGKEVSYEQISQDKAKELMDSEEEPAVVLDVRTFEEFEKGHIEDAICIPVESLHEEMITRLIPSKVQTILVYCRSGNRSKEAAEKLAKYGYISVKEFGGINDWKYGTEKR